MEKEVIVAIEGIQIQYSADGGDKLSVISPGTYYYRNNKHYITYEEIPDDGAEPVTNVLKIDSHGAEPRIELIKRGSVGTHFVFERDRNNITCYETHFGSLVMGLHAKSIAVREREDEINVMIEYALEMNYEHISDNKIEMNIKSKSCMGSLGLGQ